MDFQSPRREELYPSTKKRGGEKVYPITKKGGIVSKHQEGRNYIQAPRRGETVFPITKKGGIISKHQEGRNYIQAPRRKEGKKYFQAPRREELYPSTKKRGGKGGIKCSTVRFAIALSG